MIHLYSPKRYLETTIRKESKKSLEIALVIILSHGQTCLVIGTINVTHVHEIFTPYVRTHTRYASEYRFPLSPNLPDFTGEYHRWPLTKNLGILLNPLNFSVFSI